MAEDGGTATYGLNYYELGEQTGKMAYQVLIKKQKPQTMAVQTADKLHLYVNKANAKAIGLQLSTIQQPKEGGAVAASSGYKDKVYYGRHWSSGSTVST
ncbi:hypothetical protein WP50_19550 [Lactiplantibacillus plantarum]|nr:hypothetical protein WP50_19550 [Lactiplantibacillus plantarum]